MTDLDITQQHRIATLLRNQGEDTGHLRTLRAMRAEADGERAEALDAAIAAIEWRAGQEGYSTTSNATNTHER